RREALSHAQRVADATGARLFGETFNTRVTRGADQPPVARMPYGVAEALEALAGVKHVVLVGAAAPVSFFAYPGRPGRLYPPDAAVHTLSGADQDCEEALAALAAELKCDRA